MLRGRPAVVTLLWQTADWPVHAFATRGGQLPLMSLWDDQNQGSLLHVCHCKPFEVGSPRSEVSGTAVEIRSTVILSSRMSQVKGTG